MDIVNESIDIIEHKITPDELYESIDIIEHKITPDELYESIDIIEHKITPDELYEIFDDMTIEDLYDELPLKNIYSSYENFEKEIKKTQGETLLEKFCKLTIKKCRDRIDYLEDKRHTLIDTDTDENIVIELNAIITIEKEALNYFKTLFVTGLEGDKPEL
jgi:hypothetical protein